MNYILKQNTTVHCLFEQSGIFKNTFKSLGFNAKDYDIRNEYDETDELTDLFKEIDRAMFGEVSIFDDIGKNDIILAFFPCTFFSDQSQLIFSGNAYQMQNYPMEKKLLVCTKRMLSLEEHYVKFAYLIVTCLKRKIPLIIENPYGKQNFLDKYFPMKSKLIIKDRSLYGDFWKKPTQFFFVNCELEFSLFSSNPQCTLKGAIENNRNQKERSEISADFAKWFVENVIKNMYTTKEKNNFEEVV